MTKNNKAFKFITTAALTASILGPTLMTDAQAATITVDQAKNRINFVSDTFATFEQAKDFADSNVFASLNVGAGYVVGPVWDDNNKVIGYNIDGNATGSDQVTKQSVEALMAKADAAAAATMNHQPTPSPEVKPAPAPTPVPTETVTPEVKPELVPETVTPKDNEVVVENVKEDAKPESKEVMKEETKEKPQAASNDNTINQDEKAKVGPVVKSEATTKKQELSHQVATKVSTTPVTKQLPKTGISESLNSILASVTATLSLALGISLLFKKRLLKNHK